MRVVLDAVKLKAAMSSAGISQQDLADRVGVQRSHIGRWCTPASNDEQLDVRLSSVAKLATALGLRTIEPLLRYMPDKPAKSETL